MLFPPISEMRKQRLKEVKELGQSHTDRKLQNWNPEPGILVPRPTAGGRAQHPWSHVLAF